MKKISIFLAISLMIGANLRNSNPEINYAPGVLRTPDERFKNILDYPFKPNYLTIGDTRIHYLDEGPIDGKVIYLLMVNLPVIPTLTKAGYRVVAPDMVGFGNLILDLSIQ